MARPSPSPSTLPTPSARRPAVLAAVILAAVTAWLVYAGALRYFFSQDDFVGLARAQGLAPHLTAPWRYLSRQVFFDVMYPLAGLDAFPYHLASLIGHVAASALVCVLLARRCGTAAAAVGAVLFAAHPASFAAVYWIAAVGEIYALLFAVLALLASEARGTARWLAVPSFVVSLLFKESTVLLPVVVWAARRAREGDGSERRTTVDGVVIALAAVSVVYLATFVVTNTFGVRDALGTQAPYALDPMVIPSNLLTYLGWTVNFFLPTMRSFTDAVEPAVFPFGIVAALLWGAGLLSPALRRRGWLAAGITYLAFLAPVLPLRNHTLHYYLYAPLLGAAWCVAALPGLNPSRAAWRPATTWAAAIAVAAVLAANGAAVVRKIERAPYVHPELRSDATVDRALIAERVRRSLAASDLPDGVHLVFWSPVAIDRQRAAGGNPARESYLEQNVRAALQDGLAVRVMFPAVGEVSFTRSFGPLGANSLYAVYRPDGTLRVGRYQDIRDAMAGMEQR